jgi:hypothetical protein
MPIELTGRAVFLHANNFVMALDLFEKFLIKLEGVPNAPVTVKTVCRQFADAFPGLRGLRDTLQHQEDRSQGKDKRGKPLKLKPVDLPGYVFAPSGFLGIGNLFDDNFGATTSSGDHAMVEISEASMERLRGIMQTLVRCFAWKGPPRHHPSAGEAPPPLPPDHGMVDVGGEVLA